MHVDIAHFGQNLIRIHPHVILASHVDVISALHATLNLAQIRDIRMHSGYEFFTGSLKSKFLTPSGRETVYK